MKNIFLTLMVLFAINLDAIASLAPANALRKVCPKEAKDKFGNLHLEKCPTLSLVPVKLGSQQMISVQKAIDEEMDTWGDTILESDVDTKFEDFKIESIFAVKNVKNHALRGYQVTFSVIGWQTDCRVTCDKGRIRTAIFVSSNLKDSENLVSPDLY